MLSRLDGDSTLVPGGNSVIGGVLTERLARMLDRVGREHEGEMRRGGARREG